MIMDVKQIQEILPHRYPFLLVDRVLEMEEGKRIVASKAVTMNEYFFQGHFPQEPVMPGVLIMEALDRGDISLETVVYASEHACSMGGSQIWLEPGETMSVDELLKATVIASANDATVALGEAVSGSEEAFVKAMNKKARELGMLDTKFMNCSGLDAEGHYSTAEDIARMSCALLKHDLIKKYTTEIMRLNL